MPELGGVTWVSRRLPHSEEERGGRVEGAARAKRRGKAWCVWGAANVSEATAGEKGGGGGEGRSTRVSTLKTLHFLPRSSTRHVAGVCPRPFTTSTLHLCYHHLTTFPSISYFFP